MNNTRIGILLSIVALQFYCAGAIAGDAADIRARLQQWTSNFNRQDKAGACDLFSKTLISDVRGQGVADYKTRCATIRKALDDKQRRFHYDLDIKEIMVDKTIAVVRLDWTLKISPGDASSTESGLDIFKKEGDGRWRIIRFMAYSPD
jgi:steroid delta-isomerase